VILVLWISISVLLFVTHIFCSVFLYHLRAGRPKTHSKIEQFFDDLGMILFFNFFDNYSEYLGEIFICVFVVSALWPMFLVTFASGYFLFFIANKISSAIKKLALTIVPEEETEREEK